MYKGGLKNEKLVDSGFIFKLILKRFTEGIFTMYIKSKLLTTATAIVIATSSAQAADKVIVGQPNWAYAKAISNVIKVVAEENYGVEVDFVPGTHPIFFKAMDQGNGDVDIHPDVWLPNQQSYINEYANEKKSVVLTDEKFAAASGFCTTRKARDEHGLVSIYDLTKPEIIALTDADGDGMGELWVGAPGWTSTAIDKVKARDFGFADLYDLTESEETIILSKVDADAKAGKTVIWACYAPHHIFAIHDIVMLEEPEHDPAKWNPILPKDDPDWYDKSVVATSWPPIGSHMVYSKRLITAAPEVARMIDRMKLSTALINEWAFEISVNDRDPLEYAREWVSNNQSEVKGWLGN